MSARACLALLLTLSILLAGCRRASPPPLRVRDLAATRSFDQFPVYWAGPRFDGVPVTAADRVTDYQPSLGMRVYYGDCHRDAIFGSGGCVLPLEINTVIYKPHSNVGLGPQHKTTLRGVPAIIYDGGKSIELYSGELAIDVFADTAARALRAALGVTPLNRPAAAIGRLPAPHFRPGPR